MEKAFLSYKLRLCSIVVPDFCHQIEQHSISVRFKACRFLPNVLRTLSARLTLSRRVLRRCLHHFHPNTWKQLPAHFISMLSNPTDAAANNTNVRCTLVCNGNFSRLTSVACNNKCGKLQNMQQSIFCSLVYSVRAGVAHKTMLATPTNIRPDIVQSANVQMAQENWYQHWLIMVSHFKLDELIEIFYGMTWFQCRERETELNVFFMWIHSASILCIYKVELRMHLEI